jgi:putative thiamine transport system substrate-binding protein
MTRRDDWRLGRRRFIALTALSPWLARAADPAAWKRTLEQARGQTVYFNAWAGSEQINAYLQWAAGELERRHGVKLQHVKVSDTAEVVRRVRAEKQAGKASGGSVDMVWINGENFLAMKRDGLLFGPFAEALPAFANVDTQGKPTTRIDFAEPVDGMEAPWGMAQLTFFGDAKRLPAPPRSFTALAALARSQPGRISYPRPPDFHGTTFVKQVLFENVADRQPFYAPARDVERLTAPLWTALDALHPHLWREGRQFPTNQATMRQMMADGELLMALTFNPNEAASEIAAKRLPGSVISWQHDAGTIGNTHFLAIAFNAPAKAGTQVAIDFLMSPLAQARKADTRYWGDPTVLDVARLPASERAWFTAAAVPGQPTRSAPVWPEPHASWVEPIEREWLRRYGQ